MIEEKDLRDALVTPMPGYLGDEAKYLKELADGLRGGAGQFFRAQFASRTTSIAGSLIRASARAFCFQEVDRCP
jgi:hypothetical protein